MKPYNARVVILTPGKPQPLSETPRPVATVTVVALAANATAIHIGGSNVRASVGSANALPMSGGTRPDSATFANVDLSQIWIDAITANDGVSFLAWEA